MPEKYRVTVPEIVLEKEARTSSGTTHTVKTVLWRGGVFPDGAVLDMLLEGQAERRSRHNTHHEPELSQFAYGNHIHIEKRRRSKLGWYVVDMVHIPGL